MQELEYQKWVRTQERLMRLAPHRAVLPGSIPDFSMAFQPIVDVMQERVHAYEALVRSPDGGSAHSVLSRVPAKSSHVFDRACRSRAMALAMRCGFLNSPDTKLCVNVNPNAAVDSSSNIGLTCDEAVQIGFPLNRLVLELVEDAEITDFDLLKRLTSEYRSCGVQIAMDDFGAGYSGLKLLSKLKPDIVKLDMELVSTLDVDRTAQVIVKAIVQACFDLGITIIAEGVERYEQVLRLRDMGVAYQQGYYFARPGFEQLPTVALQLPEMVIGSGMPVLSQPSPMLRAS